MNKTTQSVCLDRVDSQDTAGHFGVAVLLEFHLISISGILLVTVLLAAV